MCEKLKGFRMRNLPSVAMLASLALTFVALPVRAATVNPMLPFAFYVGTWSCSDGVIGGPTHEGTWTFTMRGDLMYELILIPKQGNLSSPSVTNATFAFDTKNNRYVETEMDDTAAWYVSIAKPGWNNTISWRDISSWKQPAHWEMSRIDSDHFMVEAFPTATATKPNYRGVCKRKEAGVSSR
jgi:hypothetical protein